MRHKLLKYLHSLKQEKHAFFALRKSGKNQVIVMNQNNDKIHFDPSDTLSYAVFNKYQTSHNQLFIHGETINKFTINNNSSPNSFNDITVEFCDKKKHIELVDKAITTIKNTDLKKVVVSRKQVVSTTDLHEDIFLKALETYNNANVYFLYHPQIGTWVGATPEVLLSVNGTQLHTMSLAGTAVIKETVNHQWGIKEVEEQQIVTDYIVEQLKKSGCLNIQAAPATTITAGSLIHLKSSITAQLPVTSTVSQVLNRLHPTPAICGLPVELATSFIKDHEGYDREYYTGYLGIVDQQLKTQDYYVNLRCMNLTEDKATIYVGGGITASSNALSEYQETVEKIKTMLRLIY